MSASAVRVRACHSTSHEISSTSSRPHGRKTSPGSEQLREYPAVHPHLAGERAVEDQQRVQRGRRAPALQLARSRLENQHRCDRPGARDAECIAVQVAGEIRVHVEDPAKARARPLPRLVSPMSDAYPRRQRGNGMKKPMKPLRSLPFLRQLAGDPLARGRAARSERSGDLRARTADRRSVVKSVCPYCAVGCGQRVFVTDGPHHPDRGRPGQPDLARPAVPEGVGDQAAGQQPDARVQGQVPPARRDRVGVARPGRGDGHDRRPRDRDARPHVGGAATRTAHR